MAFKIGTQVIWVDDSEIDVKKHTLKTGTVKSSSKHGETVVEGEEYPRYSAFLYPDTQECRDFLVEGLQLAIRHQEEKNARMSKVYEFNNQLVRAGQK